MIYSVKVSFYAFAKLKSLREAALHDRIILYSERTEQGGGEIPPPFPSQIAISAGSVQQPSTMPSLAAEQHRPSVTQTDQPDLYSKDPPTQVAIS